MPEQYDADFAPPLAHLAEQAPVSISGVQGFKNAKKDGTVANAATRGGLNFVTGANITLTVADDSANDEVDVTIAAADAEYDVLTKVTTAVTVVNTVTETNLLNYTVAAGAIGTDKMIQAVLMGTYLNNSAGQRQTTFRVKLGGTTVIQAVLNTAADADRVPWVMRLYVAATGAADSQFTVADLQLGGRTRTATTGYGDAADTAVDSVMMGAFSSASRTAIDLAAAAALVVSVEHPVANASLEIKLEYANVAVIG